MRSAGPSQTPAPEVAGPEPGSRTPRREILVTTSWMNEKMLVPGYKGLYVSGTSLDSAPRHPTPMPPSRGPTRTVEILEPPLGITEEPREPQERPPPRTQNLLEELNETLALKGISLEDNQPGDFCSDSLWLRSS
jgi:hypothetical protein